MSRRRGFGALRKLPSGRYQASYLTPSGARIAAATTFRTKTEADAWLAERQVELTGGSWRDPALGTERLDHYAEAWLASRDLRPRTRDHYRRLLDDYILPEFGRRRLRSITPTLVRAWHADLLPDSPTMRAHAYGLLRTILNTALADDLITSNPCRVRAAGVTTRATPIRPASLSELATLTEAMPARLQAAVLLAAWLGLRFGELFELRRGDVDLVTRVVRIRRGVVRVGGRTLVGPPKTAAGVRDVAIPRHLVEVLQAHLDNHVAAPRDSLLFPAEHGGHMAPSTLYRSWYPAREAAGRPDLRWHDLRHTGATLAAATGATLAELMARLGHSTPAAAMRYQHAAADRDQAIADALADLALQPRPGPPAKPQAPPHQRPA